MSAKRRTPRRKSDWQIKVEGKMRPDIDVSLLAQAVIALGHQLADEEEFFQELQQHDEHVSIATVLPLRLPTCILAGQIFALFDGGHLVCRLSATDAAELAKKPGFALWRARSTGSNVPNFVKLPGDMTKTERIRYGLAALEHAHDAISTDSQEE